MAQTLLSVLCLALLSFLTFVTLQSRNEDVSDRARSLVQDEARGVAAGALDRLAALPFDGAAPSRTLASGFGPGPGLDPTAELLATIRDDLADLDDAHGLAREARVVLDHPVSGLDNPLVFEAVLSVDYVAATASGWQISADTTSHKRVGLALRHPGTGVSLDLRRVYSALNL